MGVAAAPEPTDKYLPVVKDMLPESTRIALGVEIVTLVPAIGGPAIRSVDAFVYVTAVFVALKVRAPKRTSATCVTVPEAAVTLSV